jgi:hypothetical protein
MVQVVEHLPGKALSSNPSMEQKKKNWVNPTILHKA